MTYVPLKLRTKHKFKVPYSAWQTEKNSFIYRNSKLNVLATTSLNFALLQYFSVVFPNVQCIVILINVTFFTIKPLDYYNITQQSTYYIHGSHNFRQFKPISGTFQGFSKDKLQFSRTKICLINRPSITTFDNPIQLTHVMASFIRFFLLRPSLVDHVILYQFPQRDFAK